MRHIVLIIFLMSISLSTFAAPVRPARAVAPERDGYPIVDNAPSSTTARTTPQIHVVAAPQAYVVTSNDYCDGTYSQEADSVCRMLSNRVDGNGKPNDGMCVYDSYHRACGSWTILYTAADGSQEVSEYCQTCLPAGDGTPADRGGTGTGSRDCTLQTGYCPPSCISCSPGTKY